MKVILLLPRRSTLPERKPRVAEVAAEAAVLRSKITGDDAT